MSEYNFVTHWHLTAPVADVWAAIKASEAWPQWWPYVETVVTLTPGDETGLGGVQVITWRTRLPYKLRFQFQVTRVEPLVALEGIATGELAGSGRWQFTALNAHETTLRYDWQVRTTKRWMNWLAPVARPFFAWNHDEVMRAGGVGLARYLQAQLVPAARPTKPSTR